MTWNWQHADWPHFVWDAHTMRAAEADFLQGAGVALGVAKNLADSDHQQISVEILSGEAVDTSAIEGEILDRGSVQSFIQRHLGLDTDRRRVRPAEAGIAEMMVDLYTHLSDPLTEDTLFHWHRLLMSGRADLTDIGAYRKDGEPMQIVSGAIYAPKVHYEAPPALRVSDEMKSFLEWFSRTASYGDTPLPALTRAGVAHLWFESIHPFEDGNGRIGRAIAEKALAQGLNKPAITGIAGPLLRHRKDYYLALEAASRTLDVGEWLLWFADKAIEAQARTLQHIEFIIAKTRLFERLRGQLNPRQEKALTRMFAEGVDGFKGGLSAANYMTITGALSATTTRDLASMVDLGALIKAGERKATRYHLNLAVT
ncbi:Fic family protein [Asticcacaulis sp. DXS10W]|uniref:Fic family protein n=1 Tax=Asticcacaulis currens TaxID=2984210 RepID=A0ABT5IDQ3_9CAUL|nr:Fic family protein [Asticcacaulis currens]MDC7694311.1 Fic family protein [Asticcacaulis currens]